MALAMNPSAQTAAAAACARTYDAAVTSHSRTTTAAAPPTFAASSWRWSMRSHAGSATVLRTRMQPQHGCGASSSSSSSTRRAALRVTASAQVAVPITFTLGDTSLSLPFSVELAEQLDGAIGALLQTFREKEKATRPQRWANMEFRQMIGGEVFVEIFCNPNAYSNAFQAKALITVKDKQLRFTSEGQLSAIKNSVDEYLTANR